MELFTKGLSMRRPHALLLAFCLIPAFLVGQVRIVLNAAGAKDTISRHIYGHFSEHLGRCIYGGYYVGEQNTAIPHTRGIRKDVVEALRKIKIPNLRWPGGCFADTYHWKDGVGPKSERPTIVNTWWGGVTEDNSFGTHEFLDLCEQLGAEPYISGNVGSGTVQELSQWVQYVNHDGVSPMSKLRKENGREKPWRVRFWGIGNETWGCGGNMTPEYYANVYRLYVTFMNASWSGGRLFRVASGAGGDDYHWTEVMMRDVPHWMLDGVGLHHYSVIDWGKKGSATAFSREEYFKTMKQALRMEELVQKHTAVMDRYDPKKSVALVVDEWGGWYDVEPGTNPGFLFQQNTMRDAMIAGVTLNTFNNHCDRVRMANLAQTVNVLQAVILTQDERMILTPTYHVFDMYSVHQGAALLPTSIETPQGIVGTDTLSAVSVSASRNSEGVTHCSLVNIDPENAQDVLLVIADTKVGAVRARILTSPRIQDHNTFENPEKVKPVAFSGFTRQGDEIRVKLPPCSVVVLEF
jgi:alpha-N-arabinofuranosidase